jgi:hypothetical protein
MCNQQVGGGLVGVIVAPAGVLAAAFGNQYTQRFDQCLSGATNTANECKGPAWSTE